MFNHREHRRHEKRVSKYDFVDFLVFERKNGSFSKDEISERGFLVVEFLESGNVVHTEGLVVTEMKGEGEKSSKTFLPQSFGEYTSPRSTTTKRPVRLMVRTPPFHGGNRGSNPLRVAKIPVSLARLGFCVPLRMILILEGAIAGLSQ